MWTQWNHSRRKRIANEPCTYPVHPPIPAPQQIGKLGAGWIRVVCHTCKLQYDADQVENYRHPTLLHVSRVRLPPRYIAASRQVFTSVDDKPAEERGEDSAE
jgi:hypothetical protein